MRHYTVIENFISDEDSRILIDRVNELILANTGNKSADGRFSLVDSKDEVIRPVASKYGTKILATFPESPYTVVSGYVLNHYSSNGFWRKHTDAEENKEYSAFIYLNDEFTGGELVFETPHEELIVYKPVKNSLVWVPSWYPHGVSKVKNGARYVLVINFTTSYLK
jgi:Rps23 Pro-64 3,4-dihydroxylase Tpa1-like proline 4-hydroxylase